MAKNQGNKPKAKEAATSIAPRFPYTTKPASLRRLLKEIPRKPKPTKFDKTLLRSWGFGDTNDLTTLRVLRAVNLVNDKNEPKEQYVKFMHLGSGAKVLGAEIRLVYAPIFMASHTPYAENGEVLKNLFNIHSGGGENTIDLQIQTFRALCESASFEDGDPLSAVTSGDATVLSKATAPSGDTSAVQPPSININLHIHLPENKTSREYENIIEDIGRHIFGREGGGNRGG